MHQRRFTKEFEVEAVRQAALARVAAVHQRVIEQTQAAHAGAAGGRVDFRAYSVGAVNAGAQKYFTVHLHPDATRAQADRAGSYFRSFGLAVDVDNADHILFLRGTYGQASAASNPTTAAAHGGM